jgi:hypothetical protein
MDLINCTNLNFLKKTIVLNMIFNKLKLSKKGIGRYFDLLN